MYGRNPALPVVIVLLLAGVVGLVSFAGANGEAAAALPVVLVLLVLTPPLVARAVARQDDLLIRRVLQVAFPLKAAASLVRYYVAFEVYGGSADAGLYHAAGTDIAVRFTTGTGSLASARGALSTGLVDSITGAMYALTGPTLVGAFLLFSWVALWGQYGFLRGFQAAMPDANHRRYAVLVMLLPSLLYWPSSLGKESLVLAGLGLAVAGLGRVYAGRFRGFLLAVPGIAVVAVIRPHVGLILGAAAALGYALKGVRSRRAAGRPLNPIAFLVGAGIIVALAGPLLSTAQRYLDLDDPEQTTAEQIQDQLEYYGQNTEQGGSEFVPSPVTSPLRFPAGALTVLFRPFPWEADNVQTLATAVEGALLLLLAVQWVRPLRLPARVASQPMLLMAAVYLVLFIIAFSIFGNFGILARQRVQALPFLLMLLCAFPRTLRRDDPAVERATTSSTA